VNPVTIMEISGGRGINTINTLILDYFEGNKLKRRKFYFFWFLPK